MVVSPAGSEPWSTASLDLASAARLPVVDVLTQLGSGAGGLTAAEAAGRLLAGGPNAVQAQHGVAVGRPPRAGAQPAAPVAARGGGRVGRDGEPDRRGDHRGDRGAERRARLRQRVPRRERRRGAARRHPSRGAGAGATASRARVDVDDLVPGDVVALGVGDVVPADLRLLEATRLECDEAVLTGESLPAEKSAEPVHGRRLAPSTCPSCAFMGTIVHQGSGRGVVVATGTATAFGRIAVGPRRAPGRDRVPGRAARLLAPARQGRGRADASRSS